MENESVTKMPIKCIVRGCSSRKITGNGILFHTIPSDSTKRAKWISMLEDWTGIRVDVHSKWENSSVCGHHFSPDSFKPETTKLENVAIPTVFLFTVKLDNVDVPSAPAKKKARYVENANQDAPSASPATDASMSNDVSNGNK